MAATNTTTGLVYDLSILPVVLIVSSAILLDRATHYETVLHRSQIQIWLWLALFLAWSKPWTTDNTNDRQRMLLYLWAHLAIFFNVLAVVAQNKASIVLSRRQQAITSALQILPLASWCAMIMVAAASLLLQSGTILFRPFWKLSLVTFSCTFVLIWFLRLVQAKRQQTISATSSTIHTSESMGIIARICVMEPTSHYNKPANTQFLDERQWYTWTKQEVMQWFVQQQLNDNDKIVYILSMHCITGEVLDALDISQLVSLNIPFGPACKLADAIEWLVERYPKPRIVNGVRQRTRRGHVSSTSQARASRDCLDLHDDEYNNNNNSIEKQLQNNIPMEQQGVNEELERRQEVPSQTSYAFRTEAGGMSEEQHEKLNQVMKDRFGLELPKLRATDFLEAQKGSKAQNGATAMAQPHPFATSVDPTASNNYANGTATFPKEQTAQESTSPIDNDAPPTSIPDHILKGMPPELQEIAKRRPDLVETIWKQRQQVLESKANVAPEISTVEEEFDSDNEDETTSLIHRDVIHPSMYKSVDKSVYPSIV